MEYCELANYIFCMLLYAKVINSFKKCNEQIMCSSFISSRCGKNIYGDPRGSYLIISISIPCIVHTMHCELEQELENFYICL